MINTRMLVSLCYYMAALTRPGPMVLFGSVPLMSWIHKISSERSFTETEEIVTKYHISPTEERCGGCGDTDVGRVRFRTGQVQGWSGSVRVRFGFPHWDEQNTDPNEPPVAPISGASRLRPCYSAGKRRCGDPEPPERSEGGGGGSVSRTRTL